MNIRFNKKGINSTEESLVPTL